jgi:hypothetical protein
MSTGPTVVASAAESGATNTFLKQLWKNVERQPGWVPLLIGYYLLLARVPETSTLFSVPVRKNLDLIVAVLTFLSYQVGDAIDKPIFRNFDGSWLDERLRFVIGSRNKARAAFGVSKGVYRVSKDILSAADSYDGSWAHLVNEFAKFLRSAAIPIILLPLLPATIPAGPFWVRVLVALAVFSAYLVLKPLHMRLLYGRAIAQKNPKEVKASKYSECDLANGSRLFFWDGRLVTSALRDDALASRPAT